MTKNDRDRELTRDEVFVPPLHELPDAWARNNAYFDYLLLKRSGWFGRIYVVALLLMMALGSFGLLSLEVVLAVSLLGITALIVGMVRAARRRA